MTPEERELLVEQVASAHRERTGRGDIASHPAWHDLDAEGRAEAFERASVSRTLEAASSSDGLSSTARAVLARIRAP